MHIVLPWNSQRRKRIPPLFEEGYLYKRWFILHGWDNGWEQFNWLLLTKMKSRFPGLPFLIPSRYRCHLYPDARGVAKGESVKSLTRFFFALYLPRFITRLSRGKWNVCSFFSITRFLLFFFCKARTLKNQLQKENNYAAYILGNVASDFTE